MLPNDYDDYYTKDKSTKNLRINQHLYNKLRVYGDSDITGDLKVGILADTNIYVFVLLYKGEILRGEALTKPQRETLEQLIIGDDVVFSIEDGNIIIKGIKERRTKLIRLRSDSSKISNNKDEDIISVNIDMAIVTDSIAQPKISTRLIDRYLIMCEYGGISPVICITKVDIKKPTKLDMYTKVNIPVFMVSNKTKEGVDKIKSYIKGKRVVVIGPSGVGKSSLINSIINRELMDTYEVSDKTGKGRHTTSTSSLHPVDNGALVIDTPGIRTFDVSIISRSELKDFYPEFKEFSYKCKFRDCMHITEPGCAVKEAVLSGLIDPNRYESYVRIFNTLPE